jgi:hypothetical protein
MYSHYRIAIFTDYRHAGNFPQRIWNFGKFVIVSIGQIQVGPLPPPCQFCTGSGMIEQKKDKWLILCRRCGKFKPQHLYDDIKRGRICRECSEEIVEVTPDLVKHVKDIFCKTNK